MVTLLEALSVIAEKAPVQQAGCHGVDLHAEAWPPSLSAGARPFYPRPAPALLMSLAKSAVADLREARRERRDFARQVHQDVRELSFYSVSRARLEATVRQAKREDEEYASGTGEPMPAHLRRALFVEVSYWMRYHDLLIAPAVREEEYATFCRSLQALSRDLIHLLGTRGGNAQ